MEGKYDKETRNQINTLFDSLTNKFIDNFTNEENKKIYNKNPEVYRAAFTDFVTQLFFKHLIALNLDDEDIVTFVKACIEQGFAQEVRARILKLREDLKSKDD